MATVNNPPSPVLAKVSVQKVSATRCANLKTKFNITDGVHGTNPSQKGKQSHHILQNSLLRNSNGNRLVTTYSGWAVMLAGGSTKPGTEHDIANKWQALRRRQAEKAKNPTPRWSDIKKWGKNDLAAAFQHGKKSRGMTNKEAEDLADCLVADAEKQIQQHRKDNGMPPLKNNNRVSNSPGCFTMDTLVWTSQAVPIAARYLEVGDLLQTSVGTLRITRVDACFSELVELQLGNETLALSPTHRVCLADGRYVTADRLRTGHRLQTRTGEVIVSSVRMRTAEQIVGIGVAHPAACFVGRVGVAVEATSSAPPIAAYGHIES